uniref:Tgr11392B n=1 Tax=Dictyostelium purpureum TaxID=5786 RepID=A0A3S9KFY6_DICPU|nr:tgr11392B [Dictyostelium purpureum]
MKPLLFIFLFLYLIKTISSFCTLKNSFLICDDELCNFQIFKDLSNTTLLNVEYNFKNLKSNTVDLFKIQDGYLLYDSNDCAINNNFKGNIVSIEPPETFGGKLKLIGFFLYDKQFNIKRIKFNYNGTYYSDFKISYSNEIMQYEIENIPEGCGSFELLYERKSFLGSYKKPIVKEFKRDESSNKIILTGTSLYKPKLKVTGPFNSYNEVTTLQFDSVSTDPRQESANFDIPQILLCGVWNVAIEICNSDVQDATLEIINEPKIEGITSVSSKDGGNVTINGKNFYSRTFEKSKSLSGYQIALPYNKKCKIVEVVPETGIIICNIEPSKENEKKKNLNLILTIDEKYTTNITFSYESPSISYVNQTSFPSIGEAQFTIFGKYLDDPSITMVSVKIPDSKFNIIDHNCSIISKEENRMVVGVPLNAFPGYIVIVSKDENEIVKSNVGFLSFLPILKNITTSNTTGQIITITGVSVHTNRIEGSSKVNLPISINVGGGEIFAKCKNPNSNDGVHIVCLMEPGVGKDLKLSVNIDKYTIIEQKMFSYNSPLILKAEYNSSGYVTLLGENFGRDPNKISIESGKTKIKLLNVNDSSLQFMIPQSFNGINYLDIIVGVPDHQNILKQYEFVVKPTILNINTIPTSGGEVTIYGNYLSTRAAISFRAPRGTPAGIPCNNITVNEDYTILKCKVIGFSGQEIKQDGIGERKTTSGYNHKIFMSIKGRNAINPKNITFSFYPPTVYGSPGKNGENNLITIIGENFNRIGLKVFVGKEQCKWPNVLKGFDTITCTINSIDKKLKNEYQNKTFDISVTVDGQTGFLKNNFTYNFKEVSYTKESNKLSITIPAIVICGGVGLITIGSIAIFKINRMRRLKKIQELLNKKVFL